MRLWSWNMATGTHILVQAETRMSAVGASLRVLWLAAVFGLGSCLPGGFLLSASAGQPPVQERALSTPADTPVPIPVPEIAERAGEVVTLLRQTREAQAPGPILQTISDALPPISEWIRDRFAATAGALDSSVSPIALATLADSWRARRSQLVTWNGVLTQQGMQLERARQQLEAVHARWTISRQQAGASHAPAPVLERVEDTIAAIAAGQQDLADTRAHVLGLQDRVGKDIVRCDDMLHRIAQAQNALRGPLFVRDAPPIWRPAVRTPILQTVSGQLRETTDDNAALVREYLRARGGRMLLLGVLFLVVVSLARLARKRSGVDPTETPAAHAFAHPISAAFVVVASAMVWLLPDAPRAVLSAAGLLVLLPALTVVRQMVSPSHVAAVYALAALFVADRVRELCAAVPALEQWVFLSEILCGILFLALVGRWRKLLPAWLIWGQVAALVGALAAGMLGFMRLARLLGEAVIASNYVALVLSVGLRVAGGLVSYLLRVRPLRDLFMVQRHRAFLQGRIELLLRWVSIGTWAYFTVEWLGVTPFLSSTGLRILRVRYGHGPVSFSVEDVLAFVLTVAGAFLLSAFIRFVLEEDVYPRLDVARGHSYAISRLFHYTVIFAGFMVAIAALGIDVNRITILVGAFGVGIGFGLQNAVANFVAGVVLLLEHRIHVGDSLHIGDLEGEVRAIGIRASTIRTPDGAEVIVPNGSLTAERVTNWTLSDRLHRIHLPLTVAFETHPERVRGLLWQVATADPKVLASPAPVVLCTGFGERGLNFELRVWVARYEEAAGIRSALVLAVHAALRAAKIEMPFPAPARPGVSGQPASLADSSAVSARTERNGQEFRSPSSSLSSTP
jgi:potassium-dependent mechanosensitive channel